MANKNSSNPIDAEIIQEYSQRHRSGTELKDHAEVKGRIAKDVGTIYSVRFSEAEMQLIEAQAEREGKRLSAFIRESALNAAVAGTANAVEGKVGLTPSEQETLFQALRQVIATKPETKPARRARRANTAAQKAASR
jgi:uncharacterized protein (DUF1778 family)